MTTKAVEPPATDGWRPISPDNRPAPRRPSPPSAPAPRRPSVPTSAAPCRAKPGWCRLPFPLGDFRLRVVIDPVLCAVMADTVLLELQCVFEAWGEIHRLFAIGRTFRAEGAGAVERHDDGDGGAFS